MLNSRFHLIWQYCLPQHGLSRLLGKLANCRWPWFKNALIKWFIQHYRVDMSIAEITDIAKYPHFNAFFTRPILPSARPIVEGGNTIACPVDGFVSQMGSIREQQILQAKGFDYDLIKLLGGDERRALPFHNGYFATLYLSPKDYHRVHMPVTGTLQEMVYIPGRLFSVNPNSVANVAGLFARNERVVCLFKTAYGPMAVILVGAMIVASIETVWAGLIAPSRQKEIQVRQYAESQVVLKKGDELGRFQFGSTVIVLFGNNAVKLSDLQPNQLVKMGQLLAIGDKI